MSRGVLVACLAGLLLGLVLAACDDDPDVLDCSGAPDRALFERRIAPLLEDGAQSSCNECHLQGVNLGLYSKDGDECTTMACMVESGLVDLEAPRESLVLDWIMRSDPQSDLITPQVVRAEHDAMLSWIEEHACGKIECPEIENPCGREAVVGTCEIPPEHSGPPRGFDDPGDCSDLTIETAFSELVYSWRGRCYPCHFDSKSGAPEDAPRWIVDAECNAGSLATMRNVLERGLVDFEQPDQSLLLVKPLAETAGGVLHGGGAKFANTEDGGYLDFRMWIEKLVACTPAPQ
jgi:hypothetical protein